MPRNDLLDPDTILGWITSHHHDQIAHELDECLAGYEPDVYAAAIRTDGLEAVTAREIEDAWTPATSGSVHATVTAASTAARRYHGYTHELRVSHLRDAIARLARLEVDA